MTLTAADRLHYLIDYVETRKVMKHPHHLRFYEGKIRSDTPLFVIQVT